MENKKSPDEQHHRTPHHQNAGHLVNPVHHIFRQGVGQLVGEICLQNVTGQKHNLNTGDETYRLHPCAACGTDRNDRKPEYPKERVNSVHKKAFPQFAEHPLPVDCLAQVMIFQSFPFRMRLFEEKIETVKHHEAAAHHAEKYLEKTVFHTEAGTPIAEGKDKDIAERYPHRKLEAGIETLCNARLQDGEQGGPQNKNEREPDHHSFKKRPDHGSSVQYYPQW